MNLRQLLNKSRFVGCVNPRAAVGSHSISVFCAETDDGVCLTAKHEDGTELALADMPLPAFVLGRVRFWNDWATNAFYPADETPYSLFGLEAYGISIALDVLRAHPDTAVDWCGLPLHDDYALMQRVTAEKRTPAPTGFTANRYLTELLRGEPFGEPRKDSLCEFRRFDWGGLSDIMLVRPQSGFNGRWWDDPETMYIYDDGYCNPHVAKAHEELEEILYEAWCDGYDLVESIEFTPFWTVSELLLPFMEAAQAVDVTRMLEPLRPVSLNELYQVGDDVLALCRNPQHRIPPNSPTKRPRRLLVTRGGKGFIE